MIAMVSRFRSQHSHLLVLVVILIGIILIDKNCLHSALISCSLLLFYVLDSQLCPPMKSIRNLLFIFLPLSWLADIDTPVLGRTLRIYRRLVGLVWQVYEITIWGCQPDRLRSAHSLSWEGSTAPSSIAGLAVLIPISSLSVTLEVNWISPLSSLPESKS